MRAVSLTALEDSEFWCSTSSSTSLAVGYNAAADRYEDLIAAGIIDPTKVVRVALQNAASVASLMLTTEAVIAEHSTIHADRSPTRAHARGDDLCWRSRLRGVWFRRS